MEAIKQNCKKIPSIYGLKNAQQYPLFYDIFLLLLDAFFSHCLEIKYSRLQPKSIILWPDFDEF